jgi:hypothetical protein
MTDGEPFLAPGLRILGGQDDQFLGGDAVAVSGGRRTEARALRAGFSERSRLRKTATKPAEFSGPNRSTQSYGIIIFYFI